MLCIRILYEYVLFLVFFRFLKSLSKDKDPGFPFVTLLDLLSLDVTRWLAISARGLREGIDQVCQGLPELGALGPSRAAGADVRRSGLRVGRIFTQSFEV